jgi:hypothetical protein
MKNLEILEELLNETKQKQKNLKKNWFSNLFEKTDIGKTKKLKRLP